MKYTEEERLEIGRRIYQGELSTHVAAEEYGVLRSCIENYIHFYRTSNGLPARGNGCNHKRGKLLKIESTPVYSEFDSMTR